MQKISLFMAAWLVAVSAPIPAQAAEIPASNYFKVSKKKDSKNKDFFKIELCQGGSKTCKTVSNPEYLSQKELAAYFHDKEIGGRILVGIDGLAVAAFCGIITTGAAFFTPPAIATPLGPVMIILDAAAGTCTLGGLAAVGLAIKGDSISQPQSDLEKSLNAFSRINQGGSVSTKTSFSDLSVMLERNPNAYKNPRREVPVLATQDSSVTIFTQGAQDAR